jgi:hypothetical protein
MSTDMIAVISQIKSQIAQLEAMLGKKSKVPKEDKPKREMSEGMKAWHEFNKRLDTLLKDSDMNFKRVAEAKQFASHLKKLKADWTDNEILTQRTSWVPPPVETVVTEIATDADTSSAEEPPKKAGRPKMTEEEKAAAKAARELKKADIVEETTPVKKASKLGNPPGAPKKPKVAWEETTEVARNLMKEADELLSE